MADSALLALVAGKNESSVSLPLRQIKNHWKCMSGDQVTSSSASAREGTPFGHFGKSR